MCLDFVAYCNPGRKIVAVRDAILFKGLIFRECVINVRITARPAGAGGRNDETKCELHIFNTKAPTTSKIKWQPSYAAYFALGDSFLPLPAVMTLRFGVDMEVENGPIYGGPDLFHGPEFQLLEVIGDLTETSLTARLTSNVEHMRLHFIMDAAMQTILKWVWLKRKKRCLPHSAPSVRFHTNFFRDGYIFRDIAIRINLLREEGLVSLFAFAIRSMSDGPLTSGEAKVIAT